MVEGCMDYEPFSFTVISVKALSNDNIKTVTWPDSDKGLFRGGHQHNPSASITIPAEFIQEVGMCSGIKSKLFSLTASYVCK